MISCGGEKRCSGDVGPSFFRSAAFDRFKSLARRMSYDTPAEPTLCPALALSHRCQWRVLIWDRRDVGQTADSRRLDSARHGEKLFIWSRGFDPRTARQPILIVTGKRLDGDAPPVAVAGGTNAFIDRPAMLIGLSFPTPGRPSRYFGSPSAETLKVPLFFDPLG